MAKRGKSRKPKTTKKGKRQYSICRNYKKSRCGSNDKCSWRKKVGCVMRRHKAKRSLMKEIRSKTFKLRSLTPTGAHLSPKVMASLVALSPKIAEEIVASPRMSPKKSPKKASPRMSPKSPKKASPKKYNLRPLGHRISNVVNELRKKGLKI